MKNPLVSVIIPIYNVEKWLPECVDSVLNQTYKNLEIILVDDGSPDSCPAICDEYAARDTRIKVIHKPNGGLSDARNAGIDVMTGDYVVFLDSDDYWLSSQFISEVVMNNISNKNPDCILIRDVFVYGDGTTKVSGRQLDHNMVESFDRAQMIEFLNSIGTLWVSSCCKILKSSIIIDNRLRFEKGLLSEDIDFMFQTYPYVRSFSYFDKPVYAYRKRDNSITHSIGIKSFDSIFRIMDKWSERIDVLPITDREKQIFKSYLAYQYCIFCGFIPKLKESKKLYMSKLRKHDSLLSYDLNPKVQKVKKCRKYFGYKLTCLILNKYMQLR